MVSHSWKQNRARLSASQWSHYCWCKTPVSQVHRMTSITSIRILAVPIVKIKINQMLASWRGLHSWFGTKVVPKQVWMKVRVDWSKARKTLKIRSRRTEMIRISLSMQRTPEYYKIKISIQKRQKSKNNLTRKLKRYSCRLSRSVSPLCRALPNLVMSQVCLARTCSLRATSTWKHEAWHLPRSTSGIRRLS